MKKFLAILLALCMILALAACSSEKAPETTAATEATTAPATEAETEAATEAETEAATEAETEAATEAETEAATEAETEAATEAVVEETVEAVAEEAPAEETEAETEAAAPVVMTHEEYVAAPLDSEVCVETYVQAHQSWWDGKITVYAQSEDGAYFIYNMACAEEDAEKLVPGTKIRVNGYKSEWSGEVEITDASFEIVEGEFVAAAEDVTALLGTDDLVAHQNELVSFKGLTVASVEFKNGEPGDDIYVSFTMGEVTADFCVEAYLTGPDSDVYAAVSALKAGDVVDVEGFLYWYNGANTHMTAVTVVEATPEVVEVAVEETAAETEAAAEAETEVTVEETVAETEAETEAATEAETEAATEAETEAATEAETEAATEAETEAATEAETEAATEAETEAATEAETEAATEAETEAATEAETEAATEAETEAAAEEADVVKVPVKVMSNAKSTVEVYDYVLNDMSSLEHCVDFITAGNFVAVKVNPFEGYEVQTVRVNFQDAMFINGYWCAPVTADNSIVLIQPVLSK